jgi:signal transduction histidine kinase
MYLKVLFVSYLIVLSSLGFAQEGKHIQLLIKKKNECNRIMASFSGSKENIDLLMKTSLDGLSLAAENDHEYKFIFNGHIALGYYYRQDFKAARKYFEQSYDEAIKANLIEKSLKPLGSLMLIYHYLGLQDKADMTAQKLKQVAESTDTLKSKTDIYYNLGVYNQQQKFYYGIALSNFLKSVELHKPIVDTTKILKLKSDYATKLMMVAEIYLQLKQPKKALEYLNEAKPYFNVSIIVDVSAYGKLIRSYVLLNNKSEALKYYNLLHNINTNKVAKWSELVSSNLEIATLYLRAKDFKTAKFYIDKADKQAKLDSKEILTSSVNLTYGDYYKKLNDYQQASKYYKLAEHGSAIYNQEQYSDLLKSLTEVEIFSGRQKDASFYFNKYTNLSDSLNQRKISLNLAEMEARFQNEYKQQKIGVLNKANEDKNVQLIEEKKTRWFLIAGTILLFIALFSIYLNFKNKQRANVLLDRKNQQLDSINEQLKNANQTKAKLFSIISHDLRSPVSQLFTFLRIQQINPSQISDEEKNIHQNSLIESSKKLLATMEDLLLWSKSQMDNFELDIETIDVSLLFNDAKLLMQNQAEAKNLQIEVGDLKLNSLKSDENILIIILRNLLQNAINHAYPNSIIYLNADMDFDGKVNLSIQNKGDIISAEKIDELLNHHNVKSKSSGYGLLIVKELLQKLNGTLQIVSSKDSTKITIIFP